MPAWTDIANAQVQQGAAVDQTLMTAFRDNCIAIAEGEADAPNMYDGLAARSEVGGIGSFAIARYSIQSANIAPGTTVPGSSLTYSTTYHLASATGVTLPGTWRCMGRTQTDVPVTLWQRIL